jgi:hypothetical protein
VGQFSGFNPLRGWVGAYPPARPGEAAVKIFALVTNTGSFHTIVCYPQLAAGNTVRVAGIQQINGASTAALRAI